MSTDIQKSADSFNQNELAYLDLAENGFYCAKCYDMVNYFIGECEVLTPKAKKFEKEYKKALKEKK